ncbi:hypothetical protein [Candidatus Litorirhabdus singularis]|nr:hypothetical protein [Candidatus Litorirhabdus singularis]
MTQHILEADTQHDIETMKNLRNFVLCFVGFAVVLAVGVAALAP